MKSLRFFLPVVVTILILVFLFLGIDLERVSDTFNASNKALLIFSPIVLVVAHICSAFRWKMILSVLNHKESFKNLLMLYFANMPISKIVPASGGEFLRAYYLKDKVPVARHSGGIFMGILLDIASLSAMAVLGGAITDDIRAIFFGLFVFLSVLGFLYFAKNFKINAAKNWQIKAENFFYFFKKSLNNPRLLFLIIFYTLFTWLLVIAFIKVLFLAFDFNMPILKIIAIHPMVTLISLAPISIWGIGTREAVMLYLYSGLAPAPSILSVGLTQSIIGVIVLPLIFAPFTYKTIKEMIFRSKSKL